MQLANVYLYHNMCIQCVCMCMQHMCTMCVYVCVYVYICKYGNVCNDIDRVSECVDECMHTQANGYG